MDDITLFNQNGFVLKKKLFTRQEIEKLIRTEMIKLLEKAIKDAIKIKKPKYKA